MQLLYCAETAGGSEPHTVRDPFWDSVTESERLDQASSRYRMIRHLTDGRAGWLQELSVRSANAELWLATFPERDPLRERIRMLQAAESEWSAAFDALSAHMKTGAPDLRAAELLHTLFTRDRALRTHRSALLEEIEQSPSLRGRLEALASTIRKLQRLSERIAMLEDPARFPEQEDLRKLRESAEDLRTLRSATEELVDRILASLEAIDPALAAVVEHYAPDRIDPVDRAVLRLATYELLFTDTPPGVVINEAIEIARRFGTAESARFVNGVLDRIAQQRGDSSPVPAA